MFAELFSGTRLVDGIVVLIVLEGVALVLFRRWQGAGIPARALLANLAAGVCLLLAMRVVLQGGAWHWFAGWLALSLVAHLTDLAGRWRDANARALSGAALALPERLAS